MNDKLKLISEQESYNYELVLEQENQTMPKMMKIVGPFLIGGEKRNGNGRAYTTNVLQKAVDNYYTERINTGMSFGETNHPDSVDVNFERACIKINSFTKDGDDFIGSAAVLASYPEYGIKGTILGDNLASILQYGGKPGVSSRGVGQINSNKVIDSVYKLIAEDVVYNPSGPGCFVDGILESKSFMLNTHGEILESAFDLFNSQMSNLPRKSLFKTEHIVNSFDTFLNSLTKIQMGL